LSSYTRSDPIYVTSNVNNKKNKKKLIYVELYVASKSEVKLS